MKKIVCFTLILLHFMVLTGCQRTTAEDAVKGFLDAAQSMDTDEISKYVNYEEITDAFDYSGDVNNMDDHIADELFKTLFTSMEFEIIESQEDRHNAIVKTDITNIDMRYVIADFIEDYISEAMSFVFASAFSSDITDEEIDEELDAILHETLLGALRNNKDVKIAQSVDIKVNKIEGNWIIDLDDNLINALTGGLLDVGERLSEVFID